jgi:hypothetical protein
VFREARPLDRFDIAGSGQTQRPKGTWPTTADLKTVTKEHLS